jgi:hypothetical protein
LLFVAELENSFADQRVGRAELVRPETLHLFQRLMLA